MDCSRRPSRRPRRVAVHIRSSSGQAPSNRRPGRCATALRYDGADAPRVVAAGRELVADKILEAARAAGVPVKEDPVLVQALSSLELDEQVPPELYRAVAEALAWAYRLTGRRPGTLAA